MVTRPGLFGNPFTDHGAEKNVMLFREWLLGQSMHGLLTARRKEILRQLPDLRGKQLACFCTVNDPCHGDVLCELANRPRGVIQTTPTNCFRACVATVLNVPIEIVPEQCDGSQWDFDVFQRWLLDEYRMQAVEITLNLSAVVSPVDVPVLCILTLESTEETTGKHCVVAYTDGQEGYRIIHDPSRKRGLLGELLSVMFFLTVPEPNVLSEF
jgi:hypothetical protein